MKEGLVPKIVPEDDDDVVVALETARVEEERGDPSEAARWLQRAASAARKQGRPDRAGEVSRAAARLSGAPPSSPAPAQKFEPLPGESLVLIDVGDDFADETIVDQVPRPAKNETSQARRIPPDGTQILSEPQRTTLEKPTPLAPLGRKNSSPLPAVRVAVKKILGGKLEARPLETEESAQPGEEEALLVAVRPGAKLF